MVKPQSGLEFLEELRKQGEGKKASYNDLAMYLEDKARNTCTPITGQFELSPLCNFNCRMCYVHLMKDQLQGKEILTVEQWKDLMYQAWKAGMLHCSLTGGECLTYPGFKELYLFLQDLGCEVTIMTNGYLIDDQWIQFFHNHRPIGIQITLYGSNDDVYERVTGKRAFETVTANIRKLINDGIPVSVTLTPNSYLGEDVLDTLRVAYELTNTVTINPLLTTPRKETGRTGAGDEVSLDLYVRLYNLQADLEGRDKGDLYEGVLPEVGGNHHECSEYGIKCGAGRSAFSINWKGIMSPCTTLDFIQTQPLEEGFLNAWARINQAVKQWPRAPECEECAYRSICNHCAAYEYQFAEPGKQPKILCERTIYFVKHGIWNKPVCE